MKSLLLALTLFSSLSFGQTFPTLKVGDGAPIDASAALEVKSTTKAVLFPRMTTTQKNTITAVNGDMVYDTTLGLFSMYQGGAWVSTASGSFVTSVGLSMPAIFTVSGSPVTSSGTLTATLASQTSNLIWASPNGSSGTPSFRSLLGADLPFPTASTIGGVQSYALVTHQWINSISTLGVISSSQPACSDLSNGAASCSTDTTNAANISSGTLPAARLPNPSASTLGGIQSFASVSHQFVNSISTSGVVAAAQPAFSDVSGTADLTTQVAGVLPNANGGTGRSAVWTADGTVYASSTTVLASTTTGSTGQVLTSNGVASPPTYQNAAGAATPYLDLAQHAVDCNWQTTSAVMADFPTSDTSCTFTDKFNTNFGTVTSQNDGTLNHNLPGYVWIPAKVQTYEVCADVNATNNSTGRTFEVQIIDNNSVVVKRAYFSNDSGGVSGGPWPICGFWTAPNTSAVTFRLQGMTSSGTLDIGPGLLSTPPTAGDPAISWRIKGWPGT